MKIIYYSLFLFLLVSCVESHDDTPISLADMEDVEASDSDIYSDISVIPLETTDSCIMKNPSIMDFDGENILITSHGSLYRFNKDGKFLNDIGKRGQGPGEYPNCWSVRLRNDTVYVFTSAGSIYKYDLSGEFLQRQDVDIKKNITTGVAIDKQTGNMIFELRDYQKTGLEINLLEIDQSGEEIGTYNIFSDSDSYPLDLLTASKMKSHNDGILIKLPFDNRIMNLSGGKLTVLKTIAKDEIPSRMESEEFDAHTQTDDRYFLFHQMIATDNHIYFILDKGREKKKIILDKRTWQPVFSNTVYPSEQDPYPKSGIALDELSGTRFFPWFGTGNTVLGLIPAEDLDAAVLERFNSKRNFENEISESSNPFLIIATEK